MRRTARGNRLNTVDQSYSLREVGKLLGLSRSVLSGLIAAGYVAPTRGPRREYRFTFPDLVVLRAAQGLSSAKIPAGRILRSLRRLRSQLPEQVPLAGLRIEAVGDAVVVAEGQTRWRADDGQYVMQFQVASPGGRLAFLEPTVMPSSVPDTSWFDRAVTLETDAPEAACEAYRRHLASDATHVGTYVNLGRLLHERGQLQAAEATYRDGLAHCGADGILLFNLAVLQEDLHQPLAATETYRAALASTPELADAHFNLARLFDAQHRPQEALRHWSAFRRLAPNV